MPKRVALELRADATSVWLGGSRAAERYDDSALVVLAQLGQLEKLSLHRQHITKLPPISAPLRELNLVENPALTSLDGIEKLVTLQKITLNELAKLDLDRALAQLAELPELTELWIGGSCVKRLPALALPSLREILLSTPLLDFEDAFEKLGDVATLKNVALYIEPQVLPDVLAPLASIETLVVRSFGDEFPRSLGQLTKLTKLALERAGFRTLPKTINKLQSLEELDVQWSSLEALPDELCECAALQVLRAGHTKIIALPKHIGNLAKLRVLDLFGCKKLKTLPATIGNLENLREVNLGWSSSIKVPETFYRLQLEKFVGPDEIRSQLTLRPPPTPQEDRVYLADDDRLPDDFGDPLDLELHLPTHTEPIPQLSKLQRLREVRLRVGNLADALHRLRSAEHLRHVQLAAGGVVPAEIGKLVQITTLQIFGGEHHYNTDEDGLASLPGTIGNLENLRHLLIGSRSLPRLPETIGNLAALESLELQAEKLEALPGTIGKLQRLGKIELFSGALLRLPTELADCAALRELAIHGRFGDSKLANYEVVGTLPALRVLRVTRHRELPLATIARALAGSALEELDLSHAVIVELPRQIGQLRSLKKLLLEGTHLKRFPPELRDLTELRYISVPAYTLDVDVRERLKDHLPKGRWKKHYRSSVTWYERSD